MDVQVNLWAVLAATVSSMVVGSIWYMPNVFGSSWEKLSKIKLKDMAANPAKAYSLTLVASFLTAFVLAHMAYLSDMFYDGTFFKNAVTTAFWVWLGFTGTRMLVHDLFENRPTKLTVINAAHELVTLLVMGAIIGWLHP